MHLIDINDLESNAAMTVDVCNVGACAAGITVAAELDAASQTVCLIEAGSYSPDEETQSRTFSLPHLRICESYLDDRGLCDSTCRALEMHPSVNGPCTVKNLHSASR